MHERSRLDHSTFWRLLATMEARSAAVEWRWHEEVPENLRPYQGQWLRAAGIEHWNGYDTTGITKRGVTSAGTPPLRGPLGTRPFRIRGCFC